MVSFEYWACRPARGRHRDQPCFSRKRTIVEPSDPSEKKPRSKQDAAHARRGQAGRNLRHSVRGGSRTTAAVTSAVRPTTIRNTADRDPAFGEQLDQADPPRSRLLAEQSARPRRKSSIGGPRPGPWNGIIPTAMAPRRRHDQRRTNHATAVRSSPRSSCRSFPTPATSSGSSFGWQRLPAALQAVPESNREKHDEPTTNRAQPKSQSDERAAERIAWRPLLSAANEWHRFRPSCAARSNWPGGARSIANGDVSRCWLGDDICRAISDSAFADAPLVGSPTRTGWRTAWLW